MTSPIDTDIGKTDEGKAHLEAHSSRVDRYLAEHIEHADLRRAATIPGGDGQMAGAPDELLASMPAPDQPAPAPAHPRPTDAGIDAPRLLQPHDQIHEQIDAGRNEAAESNENAEGMDVDNEDAMGFIGSLEPSADDCISELLLQQLGSYGRRYRRETRAS